MLELQENTNTNVPFVSDSSMGYESVGECIFKELNLMGIFLLPTLDTTHISHVNMISYISFQSLECYDPWVIPHPIEVDSYRGAMPLSPTELSYSMI